LLLASAPFVLGFAFFATTSKVTWSWLELLLSNFMTLLLVSIALNLSFYLLHTMFDELYQTQAKGIQVLQLIPVILMSALSFFMIKRCVLAAQHMGGQLSGNQESRGLNFSVASTAIKAGVRLDK
jgi:type IV secretory pathway VirB6-like protein